MSATIIDCDPGHDDAVALLLALASQEVDLLGVTTVAGNQTLDMTTANAISVLDHVSRNDISVAAGAQRPLVRELAIAVDVHGKTGLDGADLPPPSREPEPIHAVDWIANTVSRSSTPVTLVATGPLTNVALLLARHPEMESQLERIVLMGGAIGEGNVTPAAEFNAWVDPEAARRVFSSALDVTMVGLDVTHQALIRPKQLERLRHAGRAGCLVADMYNFFIPVHMQRYGWTGAPVHDAAALAHVIDGTLLETVRCGVQVDTSDGGSRGRTNVDRWDRMAWQPRHQVAVGIDAERFLALLIDRIAQLP